MTSWTKEIDQSTSYTGVGNITTSYTDVDDTDTQWDSFGGLIYLATEGSRDLIMTEGYTDYIVVSKGVESSTWAEVSDVSTSYTKVIDA